jgi:hypothetical protein
MTSSKTLLKGVYHALSLTTTANTTLTFDGKGVEGHWFIKVNSFFAFGADTQMILKIGVEIRFGQLLIENSFGSETEDFP